ncbi:hypothetical protein [Aquipuribacter sp. SD81]|uniref:hypothetical protein n=1 Tax=Aquipuribacter sp. SD81 TaxID=3127703 RepID=UPI0030198549
MHQDTAAPLLASVAHPEENAVNMLMNDLVREARTRDLAAAHDARLVHALRRRRATERSQERARRQLRLASLAAQRSEASAWSGALGVAR